MQVRTRGVARTCLVSKAVTGVTPGLLDYGTACSCALEEFDERRQERDASGYERAELDGQLVFHFLHVVRQGKFQFLKRLPVGGLLLAEPLLQFGPDRLNVVFQFSLDGLKVGLNSVSIVF